MNWLSGLSQLVAISLTFAVSPNQGRFEGRVVTETGSPLREASVLLVRKGRPDIEAENLVATDENGRFQLKTTPDALFVQKTGYLPLLYRVDGNDQAPLVVMNKVVPEARVPLPSWPQPKFWTAISVRWLREQNHYLGETKSIRRPTPDRDLLPWQET